MHHEHAPSRRDRLILTRKRSVLVVLAICVPLYFFLSRAWSERRIGHDKDDKFDDAAHLLDDSEVYGSMSGLKHIFRDGYVDRIVQRLDADSTKIHGVVPPRAVSSSEPYENVVVVTVWKRETLDDIMRMISVQSTLDKQNTAIIVVQNGEHVSILDTIKHWNQTEQWRGIPPKLFHVHSHVETGYFGRFLVPMFLQVTTQASFIIMDDDVLFGSRYFENMLRVVDGGFLATRNGRFLNKNFVEFDWRGYWKEGPVDTFDEDDEYDFGGHLWAGRVLWLQAAFLFPPPVLYNAEDFWISAVLKTKLGIRTKRVRCPQPQNGGDLELCACSMKVANSHVAAQIGADEINESKLKRTDAMKAIGKLYGYVPLSLQSPSAVRDVKTRHREVNMDLFKAHDETRDMFRQCLFWY